MQVRYVYFETQILVGTGTDFSTTNFHSHMI